jgi:putative NIF3 family GTP cyclohydrolase 1 type 2
MTTLKALLEYTNELLSVERFRDYAPNGLQVEGRAEVGAIVSGVTASLELLEQAIAAQADAILVHHGYFWKGEDPCVTGMKRRRLARLLEWHSAPAGRSVMTLTCRSGSRARWRRR